MILFSERTSKFTPFTDLSVSLSCVDQLPFSQSVSIQLTHELTLSQSVETPREHRLYAPLFFSALWPPCLVRECWIRRVSPLSDVEFNLKKTSF